MTRKMATAAIQFGMAQIPFGIAKASAVDAPDLKSLCDCGSPLGYMADEDGNKIQCKDAACDHAYSWWNAAPAKGFELGDEIVPLDSDEVDAARERTPVDTGAVEKAAPVDAVLLEYAVEGNYYLLPEDGFEDQYGALVGALNETDRALLTYLELRSKTQRFAIVSEGGVLIALLLRDKKAVPSLEYGVDDAMEQQATTMIESVADDDPALPEVEGQGLKDLVAEKVGADAQAEPADKEEIAKEV